MNTAKAIITGAALIALSVVFVSMISRAEAQHPGPFQLMHHSNTQASAGIFRLDTGTGEVSYCFLSAAAIPEHARLICSKPVL